MGKLTFRRVVTTLKRSLVVALLPIAGGTLFFLGSLQPPRGPTPRAHDGRREGSVAGNHCKSPL